jgi:dienelactone hydrolase
MKGLFSVLVIVGFATSAMAGEKIVYSANGMELEGYHAKAAGKARGLVLVVHDWDGLTDYEIKRTDMLADMNYDAFAIDLYGKGNRPKDRDSKKAEASKLYKDREKMRLLLLAGLDQARKLSTKQTMVMGYCFGGTAALEMARSGKARNIEGYAIFHGGLKTPAGQSYPPDTPPLLIAHGGADKAVKMADVAGLAEELEKAGINYDINVYSGAPHAFTVIGSPRYRENADKKSWQSLVAFMEDNLK